SQFGRVRERQIQCANQLALIAIIHQQPFNAICNWIGRATVSAGDNRRPTTHRFKDDMTETIGDWIKDEGRGFPVMLIEFISRESRHVSKHSSKTTEKLFRQKHVTHQSQFMGS